MQEIKCQDKKCLHWYIIIKYKFLSASVIVVSGKQQTVF